MGHEGTTFTLAPLPRGRWCRGSTSLHGIHCLGLGFRVFEFIQKGGQAPKNHGIARKSRGPPQ